ncbi:hypothetical protein AU106_gp078 [Sinorhizobium phage phiM9]|uniref:Uncharacterized protein n=1 Tax=Sinorhizobium phage phiM9 TaxID=1636182 RepID=A0A0F6TH55_9CAUD|nr:hypothetical protein AU106_gp078 [Sinorhizobium phage phiM9]AKE44709.1 hypothetical protein Sm_phiM9_079 [Sinorhizobium phage phiM9]
MSYKFTYFGTTFSCSAADDFDALMQANYRFRPAKQPDDKWVGHHWKEVNPNEYEWRKK